MMAVDYGGDAQSEAMLMMGGFDDDDEGEDYEPPSKRSKVGGAGK